MGEPVKEKDDFEGRCISCMYWTGDKEKAVSRHADNPISSDLFKGWPEPGNCNISYEWLYIHAHGDASVTIEVDSNFGCPYYAGDELPATNDMDDKILFECHNGRYVYKRWWSPVFRESGVSCYEPESGEYIGGSDDAIRLCIQMGLTRLQKAKQNDFACSVGFSESEQRWYAWKGSDTKSFGIGSEVKECDTGYFESTLEYWNDKPTGRGAWTANTLDCAKQMALDYLEGLQ